ncbi:TetR/AcrR family transcriptional regulator [Hungatella hathewayi]|uniref:TetR/AcrR family transcriptional regulator n=1 Tax=Hungatella hathewayi TaxID=154046 RepID=UPI00356667A0
MSRTQKDFAPRKEKLIEIALDQFLEKGYEDTTITDLQKAFGLTKGGMYHYFSGKEAILDAVIEKGLGDLIDEWRNHVKDLPEKDRLLYVCFTNTANSFSSRLLQYGRSGGSSIVTYKLREQRMKMPVSLVTEIIKQYIDSGFYICDNPEEIAEILLVLAVSISDQIFCPSTDKDKRKRRIDAMLTLWKNYVHPPESHLEELRDNLNRFYENGMAYRAEG